jgi:hypothetical protein
MVVEVVTLIALVRFDILAPALNLSYRQCQQAEVQGKYIKEKHYTASTSKNCRGGGGYLIHGGQHRPYIVSNPHVRAKSRARADHGLFLYGL